MREREGCYAPVFEGANAGVCLLKILAYLLLIMMLALLIWIPGIYCIIKQLIFRIQHCTEGNENPNIPL